MAETVKLGTLKLGGAVVPLVMGGSTARIRIFRMFQAETGLGAVVPLGGALVPLVVLSGSTAWKGGSTTRVGILRRSNRGAIIGRKWMISVAKFDEFRGWKVGKLGEMLDPLETKQIHGSKSTKHHQTNKSQKKIGAIFGREFSNLGRKQQNQVGKQRVGAPKT